MGDAHSLLVARGYRGATEGKAGRVQMMEALLAACLDTNDTSQFAQQPVTPIRMDLLERPTQFAAIEHLRLDPFAKQESERFIGKKRGLRRERMIGKPQAIEDHVSPASPGVTPLAHPGRDVRQ